MPNVVKVYSTPTCPWCKRVKQLLEDNKVPFQDINVAGDKTARDDMFKKTGQLGVPVTDIDGEIVIGFDEAKLREKLSLPKS